MEKIYYMIILLITFFIIYYIINVYKELITRNRMLDFINKIFIKNNINYKSKILDFGGGNCLIKKRFEKYNIQTIDIIKNNNCKNYIKYDGFNIPYSDKYFDLTICMFVLHHIPHQNKIIKEIKRVSKNIVILEDNYSDNMNLISKLLCKYHYLAFNQPMSYTKYMKNKSEWKKYFIDNGLKIINTYDISGTIAYPVSHSAFICK